MFNYKKFEDEVVEQMTAVFDKWIRKDDDLYIFSLDCSRNMDSIGVIANTVHYLDKQAEQNAEDYWYYKYCEEEWELFATFEVISEEMQKYLKENSGTNHAAGAYSKPFDEHCDKIMECCKNALIRFRQSISQNYQNILLTFNVREYLEKKERIKIFKTSNSENAFKEYAAHIDAFA